MSVVGNSSSGRRKGAMEVSSSSSCLRHAWSGQLLLSSSSSSRSALLLHGTTPRRRASGSNAMRMRPILRCVGGLDSSTSSASMWKLDSDGLRKDYASLLRAGAIERGGWGLSTKLSAAKRDRVIVHASASAEHGLLKSVLPELFLIFLVLIVFLVLLKVCLNLVLSHENVAKSFCKRKVRKAKRNERRTQEGSIGLFTDGFWKSATGFSWGMEREE